MCHDVTVCNNTMTQYTTYIVLARSQSLMILGTVLNKYHSYELDMMKTDTKIQSGFFDKQKLIKSFQIKISRSSL